MLVLPLILTGVLAFWGAFCDTLTVALVTHTLGQTIVCTISQVPIVSFVLDTHFQSLFGPNSLSPTPFAAVCPATVSGLCSLRHSLLIHALSENEPDAQLYAPRPTMIVPLLSSLPATRTHTAALPSPTPKPEPKPDPLAMLFSEFPFLDREIHPILPAGPGVASARDLVVGATWLFMLIHVYSNNRRPIRLFARRHARVASSEVEVEDVGVAQACLSPMSSQPITPQVEYQLTAETGTTDMSEDMSTCATPAATATDDQVSTCGGQAPLAGTVYSPTTTHSTTVTSDLGENTFPSISESCDEAQMVQVIAHGPSGADERDGIVDKAAVFHSAQTSIVEDIDLKDTTAVPPTDLKLVETEELTRTPDDLANGPHGGKTEDSSLTAEMQQEAQTVHIVAHESSSVDEEASTEADNVVTLDSAPMSNGDEDAVTRLSADFEHADTEQPASGDSSQGKEKHSRRGGQVESAKKYFSILPDCFSDVRKTHHFTGCTAPWTQEEIAAGIATPLFVQEPRRKNKHWKANQDLLHTALDNTIDDDKPERSLYASIHACPKVHSENAKADTSDSTWKASSSSSSYQQQHVAATFDKQASSSTSGRGLSASIHAPSAPHDEHLVSMAPLVGNYSENAEKRGPTPYTAPLSTAAPHISPVTALQKIADDWDRLPDRGLNTSIHAPSVPREEVPTTGSHDIGTVDYEESDEAFLYTPSSDTKPEFAKATEHDSDDEVFLYTGVDAQGTLSSGPANSDDAEQEEDLLEDEACKMVETSVTGASQDNESQSAGSLADDTPSQGVEPTEDHEPSPSAIKDNKRAESVTATDYITDLDSEPSIPVGSTPLTETDHPVKVEPIGNDDANPEAEPYMDNNWELPLEEPLDFATTAVPTMDLFDAVAQVELQPRNDHLVDESDEDITTSHAGDSTSGGSSKRRRRGCRGKVKSKGKGKARTEASPETTASVSGLSESIHAPRTADSGLSPTTSQGTRRGDGPNTMIRNASPSWSRSSVSPQPIAGPSRQVERRVFINRSSKNALLAHIGANRT
ncbi:unnamed protein product [Somion occarium]|uniref:Uncharacterized protein n=1 Tax=Somion occarium TaxID=3059160 RepID=A0ABP1DCA5_9APHY